jgi:hypothetical protein
MPLEAKTRDDGRFEHAAPETKAWIEGLTNRGGKSCCSTADGIRPEEVEWDVHINGYRVRIDGRWHEVPDYALLKERNRLGFAIVWFFWVNNGSDPPDDIYIMCFLPGSGA